MPKKVYESDNIQALADKMRELTGTSTQYTTYDFADGVEQVYNVGYEKGYDDGKSQGGGGGGNSDPYGVEEMLTTLPFLRKVETNMQEDGSITCSSGLIVGTFDTTIRLFVVLPWITEVGEYAFDPFYTYEWPFYVIFLPKTPPIVGWQGMWASDGGNNPPQAIFVPDESIEAYKTTTNLADFADIMKPLSQYNGEGYYGGLMQ